MIEFDSKVTHQIARAFVPELANAYFGGYALGYSG